MPWIQWIENEHSIIRYVKSVLWRCVNVSLCSLFSLRLNGWRLSVLAILLFVKMLWGVIFYSNLNAHFFFHFYNSLIGSFFFLFHSILLSLLSWLLTVGLVVFFFHHRCRCCHRHYNQCRYHRLWTLFALYTSIVWVRVCEE